jgi:hypothetical protein
VSTHLSPVATRLAWDLAWSLGLLGRSAMHPPALAVQDAFLPAPGADQDGGAGGANGAAGEGEGDRQWRACCIVIAAMGLHTLVVVLDGCVSCIPAGSLPRHSSMAIDTEAAAAGATAAPAPAAAAAESDTEAQGGGSAINAASQAAARALQAVISAAAKELDRAVAECPLAGHMAQMVTLDRCEGSRGQQPQPGGSCGTPTTAAGLGGSLAAAASAPVDGGPSPLWRRLQSRITGRSRFASGCSTVPGGGHQQQHQQQQHHQQQQQEQQQQQRGLLCALQLDVGTGCFILSGPCSRNASLFSTLVSSAVTHLTPMVRGAAAEDPGAPSQLLAQACRHGASPGGVLRHATMRRLRRAGGVAVTGGAAQRVADADCEPWLLAAAAAAQTCSGLAPPSQPATLSLMARGPQRYRQRVIGASSGGVGSNGPISCAVRVETQQRRCGCACATKSSDPCCEPLPEPCAQAAASIVACAVIFRAGWDPSTSAWPD